MKKIIVAIICAVFAFEANAQFKIGVKGGWNFENFDISGKIGDQLKKKNSTSWELGAVAQFGLAGNLYLQPEILYSSQKVKLSAKNEDVFSADPNAKISYVIVPINLMYKFKLVAIEPFVMGGPYIGLAVDRNNFSKENVKKNDWGIGVGAGVDFMKFQISARYNWALKNISDAEDIKWKNNKFNISVAFFIL